MASLSASVRPNSGALNLAYSPVRAALARRNASEDERPAARSVRMIFWYSAMRRERSALRSISVLANLRPDVRIPLLSLSIADSHEGGPGGTAPAGGTGGSGGTGPEGGRPGGTAPPSEGSPVSGRPVKRAPSTESSSAIDEKALAI